MDKLVIIINGRGGVGKDTLCDMAAKAYSVRNISSITPIKEIAASCGWNGEKDDKSRKFLSDLKRLVTEYNDYPNQYLMKEYEKFLGSDEQILFVHIRECREIDKFRSGLRTPCAALLVKRSSMGTVEWGNASDDQVEKYKYDYSFDNNKPLSLIRGEFIDFLNHMMEEMALA